MPGCPLRPPADPSGSHPAWAADRAELSGRCQFLASDAFRFVRTRANPGTHSCATRNSQARDNVFVAEGQTLGCEAARCRRAALAAAAAEGGTAMMARETLKRTILAWSARCDRSDSPGSTGDPALSGGRGGPEEQGLLEGVRREDEGSYGELVRHHADSMLAVAWRLLRHETEARDAVREAFHHAFRSIRLCREEPDLSGWLERIAVDAALVRLRLASGAPDADLSQLLPGFDERGRPTQPIIPWSVTAVESVLLTEEDWARVWTCIERLPRQYRAALVMRYFEGLTPAETAAVLGVPRR